ncbi:MAG: hypothetical protein SGILL_006279 [Bacillariaceae sp.]
MKASLSVAALLLATAQETTARSDIHFLLYDSPADASSSDSVNTPLEFLKKQSARADIKTTVFGGQLRESHASVSSSKLLLLKPLLEVFPSSDELIVIGDAQHVALNLPEDANSAKTAIGHFIESFHKLTGEHSRSVVFSADDHCCSGAMSHVHPNNLFADDGSRLKRTCTPGYHDCQPVTNDITQLWKESMQEVARETESPYMYLNSGMLAGYKNDLLHLLEVLKVDGKEDDQTVLSALLLSHPEIITLDYQQELFGNSHNANRDNTMEGCKFEHYDLHESQQLVHIETKATPLVLQTSGKFQAVCMDFMIEQLGGVSQGRYLLTSDFFEAVADFEESDTDRGSPLPPPTEEDPMNTFFGAGNETPETSMGRFVSNDEPDDAKPEGIHDISVDEDNVDSSGFDFPDLVPNYMYGNYGNYGGNNPGDNFWNYGINTPTGDNDNVSNYGGEGGNENSNMGNYGVINPTGRDDMMGGRDEMMWSRPRTSEEELPRAKTPIGQLQHERKPK